MSSKIEETREKAKKLLGLLKGFEYAEFVICDGGDGWLELDDVEFKFDKDLKITEFTTLL